MNITIEKQTIDQNAYPEANAFMENPTWLWTDVVLNLGNVQNIDLESLINSKLARALYSRKSTANKMSDEGVNVNASCASVLSN